jgi:hypothetical protein
MELQRHTRQHSVCCFDQISRRAGVRSQLVAKFCADLIERNNSSVQPFTYFRRIFGILCEFPEC